MQSETPVFLIDTLPVYGDLVLSPMEGFSDLPYRSLCRTMGSAMSYTEFINAMDVLNNSPHLEKKCAYLPEERPVVYQIFDNDPERILEAALRLQALEPDVIDINMGCSVRRVSGRGAGAGLLRTPEKIERIFYLLSRSLEVPVTGKIRLGWDEETRNYLQVAKIIEDNGGAMVAVHGRTRSQGYSGRADWDAIAEVKQALAIPVIGNGDVQTPQDIERMKFYTNCDAVMIGRGAIGNPWIFQRVALADVSNPALIATMLEHLDRHLAFYGEEWGIVTFRKHANTYLKRFNLTAPQRKRLFTTQNKAQFIDVLTAFGFMISE